MNSSEQIRQRAIECGRMTNFLRNKKSKVEWNVIADRYLRFAQWYDDQVSMAKQMKQRKANRKKSDSH